MENWSISFFLFQDGCQFYEKHSSFHGETSFGNMCFSYGLSIAIKVWSTRKSCLEHSASVYHVTLELATYVASVNRFGKQC